MTDLLTELFNLKDHHLPLSEADVCFIPFNACDANWTPLCHDNDFYIFGRREVLEALRHWGGHLSAPQGLGQQLTEYFGTPSVWSEPQGPIQPLAHMDKELDDDDTHFFCIAQDEEDGILVDLEWPIKPNK